jgi:hypothetical protein
MSMRIGVLCVVTVFVSNIGSMEMNEKELKKYNQKYGKKGVSSEQLSAQQRHENSILFFETVANQGRGWEKSAKKIVEQGIDPDYRDPNTQQSLLEIWIAHKREVRNAVVKMLVHAGVPFTSTGKDSNSLLSLCLDKYKKNLKELFKVAPTKGAAYEIKQALYGYIADRIALIHTRNIAPLIAFKRFTEQKENNIIARQLQKQMVKQGGGYELFEDLCQAFNQVGNLSTQMFQINVEHHFEPNFWSFKNWELAYKGFYSAKDSKDVPDSNLFKTFLYWKKK